MILLMPRNCASSNLCNIGKCSMKIRTLFFSCTVALLLMISLFPQFLLANSTTPSPTSSASVPTSIQPAYDTVQQLQSNLSSSPQDTVLLCADGKGPLLEGEERIFPCAGQCPAGFECEFVKGLIEGGICCPNLGELYRHVLQCQFWNSFGIQALQCGNKR